VRGEGPALVETLRMRALPEGEVVEVVVKLRCPYCGYVWEYKGKKMYYATCPNCLRKVNIQKNRVE